MAFVTIKTYTFAHEAALAKAKLKEAGIDAFIKDELTIQTDHFMSQAVGGVKLQVHHIDIQNAKEVLSTFYEGQIVEAPVTTIKVNQFNKKCPTCQSENYSINKAPRGISWLVILFFRIPLFFNKKEYYCFECHQKWKTE